MIVAVQREPRSREHRVSLAPSGVKALVQQGHQLLVERGAGVEAGHPDVAYEEAGAKIAYDRMEIFGRADLVTGVFAPGPEEYERFRPGQTIFAFWALPTATMEEFRALQARGVTAISFEAITDPQGRAPVLTCMSEIAGSLVMTLGATYLLNEFGGKGILLGGAPGVPPANVVILGAGTLGRTAAGAALGAGAQVTLLDVSVDHLRQAVRELARPVRTMLATRPHIEEALVHADIVLTAAAMRGERAPLLITRSMLGLMQPGSVIMDVAIDMGGCCETSRPTSFPHPVFEVQGILHFCVPNIPSVVARSSTQALTNALLPYLQAVTADGIDHALETIPDLRSGLYLYRGRCAHESLARVFGVPFELPTSGEQRA
jgi:alanine dehydrogenase